MDDTHTHSHVETHTHVGPHICTLTRRHTLTLNYKTQSHTHIHTHTYINPYTDTHAHTHTRTLVTHTPLHKYPLTHLRTHTHMRTHGLSSSVGPGSLVPSFPSPSPRLDDWNPSESSTRIPSRHTRVHPPRSTRKVGLPSKAGTGRRELGSTPTTRVHVWGHGRTKRGTRSVIPRSQNPRHPLLETRDRDTSTLSPAPIGPTLLVRASTPSQV